jgi:hypothetical protein
METCTICFGHENQACPPALSDVGSLCLILRYKKWPTHVFWRDVWCRVKETNHYQYSFVDGTALEQMLKFPICKDFREYAQEIFITYVSTQTFHLHHVWARYATPTVLTHSDLVQEQSMEKKCADVWPRHPCPVSDRALELSLSGRQQDLIVQVCQKLFSSG